MIMRRLIPFFLLLLLVAPSVAAALDGHCEVLFFGSSTLHDFDGKGSCTPFSLDLGEDGTLKGVQLNVPVAGMDTDNDSRDKKMREMFEADKFPQIVGLLEPAPAQELRQRLHLAVDGSGSFPLTLRIRDTEQQVEAQVSQLVDTPEAFNADLEFRLSLKSYQLEPPSVLFISVADEIRVQVKLHLAPLPTPWQP
jgi:hypothetical protein